MMDAIFFFFLLQDLKVMHLVGPNRPEVKRRVARQCLNSE